MQSGLISVIVPVYNAESCLKNCVNSILAQTYTNLEIILVNDGSPDNSGEICDVLAKSDGRIKVFHKPNDGAASARNAGIDMAQGEFVAFVDSDDTIDMDMYERLYRRIIETGADICVCGYKMIYEGYNRASRVLHEKKLNTAQLWEAYLIDFRSYYHVTTSPCNKLTRMSLLHNKGCETRPAIRFPEYLRNAEDTWFSIECYAAAKNGIAFINFVPYNYMMSTQNSLSKSAYYDDRKKLLEHLRDIMIDTLPHKTEEIEKIINCQIYMTKVICNHTAIINKFPKVYKLDFDIVKTICRYSNSNEKMSALMMFFLPDSFYRMAFRIYCKGSI